MEETQYTFRIKDIQILSKELMPPPLKNIGDVFNFDVRVEAKVIADIKVIIWVVYVGIRESEQENYLAKFTIGTAVEIINFDEIIKKNEKGLYDLPIDLDNMMKGVSISTCRGVIYSELRGTYLSKAILPVIFIDQLKPYEAK